MISIFRKFDYTGFRPAKRFGTTYTIKVNKNTILNSYPLGFLWYLSSDDSRKRDASILHPYSHTTFIFSYNVCAYILNKDIRYSVTITEPGGIEQPDTAG